MDMTCDADCTRAGWKEVLIYGEGAELHVSHHPGADLEGRFRAFCHDEQEIIWLNGWLIESIEPIGE